MKWPLRQVEELFDRAADLPADQQAAFLEEQCAGDRELRAAVERLLHADSEAPAAELVLQSPMAAPRPATRDPLFPDTGRYRAVRVLGEGGMGIVYEAEQDHPRRTVALKVIRPGMASTSLLNRFAREAQILGRLQHPGIAQVYDAGLADNGVPYLVMELVTGVPLDRYAAEQGLDTRSRLELMARVCDAAWHAHERGIVHRDLKPGNILVEPSGQPKVLDFGVARGISGLTVAGGHTEAGQLIGTLNYMSPEQAVADPKAADARADVYALGIILYELLAHRLPYSLDGLSLPEAVRVIMEREPLRLGIYDSILRGDVESIVAKALEKERGRRYSSAGELADDIRRHLNHESIRARPNSALYQLRKFAVRNRPLVGGVLAVMVALVFGAIVSLLYAFRAEENSRMARENQRLERYQTYRARLAAATMALTHHDVAAADRELQAAPEELRGWEWHHLHAQLDDSSATRSAFELAPRDDNTFVLAYLHNDTLEVTNEAGQRIDSYSPLMGTTRRSRFSLTSDGRWRFAKSQDAAAGTIRVRGIDHLDAIVQLKNGSDGVFDMDFSPDGTRLAVVSNDRSIHLCDIKTGVEVAHWDRERIDCNEITFSRDGRRLAVASDSAKASVWDVETGKVSEFDTSSSSVLTVAFDPSGNRLVTGTLDGAVRQWDVETGQEIESPYERHNGPVTAVAYSPDGERVASAGEDRLVRVWQAKGRQDEAVLHGHSRIIKVLSFSHDGRRLASIDEGQTLHFWDTTTTWPVLRGHTAYVYPIAFTPNGRQIVSGSWDGTVRIWDAMTGKQIGSCAEGGFIRSMVIRSDGKKLMTMGDQAQGLSVWDLETQRREKQFDVGDDRATALALRPDGAHLALLGYQNDIKILDANSGQKLFTVPSHVAPHAARRELAYSPDGRFLAGPFQHNLIALWDTKTYRRLKTFAGHSSLVFSIAFSPDGRQLATSSGDSTIRVWDVATGKCRLTMSGHADEVFALAFHPDGTRLASVGRDRLLHLWDLATGEELVRLPGHTNYIYALAFSPDGKNLISSSGDMTIRLWSTEPMKSRFRGVNVAGRN